MSIRDRRGRREEAGFCRTEAEYPFHTTQNGVNVRGESLRGLLEAIRLAKQAGLL